MRYVILTFLLALATVQYAQLATMPSDLRLTQLDGSPVAQSEFARAEGPTLIALWATWCAPCKKELDAYAKTYSAWREDYGVEIYALNVDQARAVAKVPALVAERGWPFPVLLDAEQNLLERFGLMSIPQMYILDRAGQIVYEHAGFAPEDLEHVAKVLAQVGKG